MLGSEMRSDGSDPLPAGCREMARPARLLQRKREREGEIFRHMDTDEFDDRIARWRVGRSKLALRASYGDGGFTSRHGGQLGCWAYCALTAPGRLLGFVECRARQ